MQEKGELEYIKIEDNKSVYYQLPTQAPNKVSLIVKQPIQQPIHNLSEGVQVKVWIPPWTGEKWIEMKKELVSKYKVLQEGNVKPIIVTALSDEDAKKSDTFLVKIDTSALTGAKTPIKDAEFINGINSHLLSGKHLPKQEFMEKIGFDSDLFNRWLHDGIVGDAGAEVFIV